jgi:ribonucleoside-diphosphate reductase alpha chain
VANVAPLTTHEALAAFDDHAVAIAKRQYFQPGDEDLIGMFRRVATWVATPEDVAERSQYAETFFDLMISKRFCPGGRVLAGAATSHGNVLNCFVQDGRPETEGDDAWVIRLASKLAVVTKVGGGNGLNLDPIAPKRPFTGTVGRLYLTIAPSHPDYDKVRDGTFMDLVHGTYVTRGYRASAFVEYGNVPSGVLVKQVGDSIESIWQHAGDIVTTLLSGQDLLLDLSALRAEGTPVNGSGGTSSGPSSFAVEVFDNFARYAQLGGAKFAGPVATLRYVFAPTLRAIRQGGCLAPDTLVHTSGGTLRLSELVDPYQYGWQDHRLKVATDEGWKDSPRGFNNGNAATKVVRLANGQRVQGTENHRLKVLRENGEREWVRLDELRPGDHVITVLDQHTGAPVTLRPVPVPYHTASRIEMPELLTERLAFFLGVLWGDGFVTDDRVGVAVAHGSPLEDEVPRLAQELFGVTFKREQKPDDASCVFVAKASHLIAYLRANGLVKGKARDLALPRAVRMAPRPVVASFLRGLFEADGSLIHGYPVVATASGRLAEDVLVMLAGLGIPASIRRVAPRDDRSSRRALHHVRVSTRIGLERFVDRIGFTSGSRLAVAAGHLRRDAVSDRSWPLPHGAAIAKPALSALPASAKGRSAPHADPVLADRLPTALEDEVYVAVESVRSGGRSLTLDLSVDDNKTYLANGVVSHNTRRGAGMATMTVTHPDIRDFITSKDLEREEAEGDISTFNISVLVGDAFMREAMAQGPTGILHEIAEHAWASGEPGLIYIDRINQHNPMRASLGEIKATNPCVTADTWVMTQQGARQVRELVGKEFCVVVEGLTFPVESRGFFQTGVKPVKRLRTAQGFELRLTADHRVQRVRKRSRYVLNAEWCEAGHLRPGDEIVVSNQRRAPAWSGAGTREQGWLLGMLVGDGTFRAEPREMACLDLWGEERGALAARAEAALRAPGMGIGRLWRTETDDTIRLASDALTRLAHAFGVRRGEKRVTDEIERASFEFYRGFLQGLFDADGEVKGTPAKGVSVRLAQSDEETLRRVQRMLARLGVIATLYRERRAAGTRELPNGRGGTSSYRVRAQHELVIANDNVARFAEVVGFGASGKRARLDAALAAYVREANRERFVATVTGLDDDGVEAVFDVTVAEAHAFDANGIKAHNCGEIPLFPGEPCDLGAINLAQYVAEQDVGLEGFDFETFRADVGHCIRFLDNVLEVNKFALEDNREMSHYLRRLGLGIMGLADALIRMGYRYDSDEGRAAVSTVIGELREAATAASRQLADERGVFPGVGESSLSAPRRNIALLTVAPTGTTSMLMGVSSGVEPIFAPFIYRKIGSNYAAIVAPLFKELLERHAPHPEYQEGGAWDWEKVVERVQEAHGSVQHLDFIPDDVKAVLVCAHDIAPEDHVLMQGVVQSAFDAGGEMVANSISKTINLPNEASVDDVYGAYSLAFETGCKGITVYRDGSRQFQVLSTKAKKDGEPRADAPKESTAVTTSPSHPPTPATVPTAGLNGATSAGPAFERLPSEPLFDRPVRLDGFTDAVKLTLPTGEKRGFYVTVNKQDGLPVECFVTSGKAGDEANADSEALGRVVSVALQYGVPAEAIVKTLRGINGGMYGTYQGRMVASRADLIAVALETAGVENVLQRGKGCPDCGAPLRFEEGCAKCASCGYSKCG